jgi:hypothetical protein
MRTKVLLVLAALLMAIVSTVAIGSNMGFKISIPLTGGQAKFVSLPYYSSFADAGALRNDLIAAGAGSVTLYNFTGTTWQSYSGGGLGQVNFPLVAGNAYQVSVSTTTTWVVVGSHNPGAAVAITGGQAKYVSIPYHTTATNASTLRNELIAAGAGSVTLYNYTGTTWQQYSGGGLGQVDFALVPGNGYQASCSTSVSWTPAHY